LVEDLPGHNVAVPQNDEESRANQPPSPEIEFLLGAVLTRKTT